MAEWRVGGKLKRTLYRDEQLVGLVDTGEIAAEIVETMNRVGRLLDEVRPVERQRREAAGERSQAGRVIARATCGRCERVVGVTDDGRLIHHDGSVNRYCNGSRELADPQPRDAERRSEATPQNDLQTPAITYTEFDRIQDQLSRVDPYDTTKGGITE